MPDDTIPEPVRWTMERANEAVTATKTIGAERAMIKQIIGELLAERDAPLAAQKPAPSYRLPDWLGGHECQIATEHKDNWVTVEALGVAPLAAGQVMVNLRRDQLVEVKPPSIDDPTPLPLEIVNGDRWVVRLLSPRGTGAAGLEMMTPEGDPAIGVVLSANALRLLARAAWQRANAVEAGAS